MGDDSRRYEENFMWIILGLISAFFNSFFNISVKKVSKNFDPVVLSWVWIIFSLPVIFIPSIFFGFSNTDNVFWVALSIRTILDTIAVVLYVRAFRFSDLTLAQPMLGLTPIFVVLTSYIIYGDVPSNLAFFGIVLVSIGIYLNNLSKDGKIFDPFIFIWKNKGVRYMTFVSIIWAITTSLHTLAIRHSDPYTYAAIGTCAIAFLLTCVVLLTKRSHIKEVFSNLSFFQIFKIGFFDSISNLSQLMGQGLTQASYLISMKRLSIIISAFLAKKYLNEDISNRILPISMVALGVILIIFGK